MRCSAKREVVSMDRLADWIRSACARLDIDAGQADTAEMLELAREVWRVEGRPAAIVAAYLLGVAVGRGVAPGDAAARLAELIRQRSDATCDWRD
jgi:uncharacterized protein DUF6457